MTLAEILMTILFQVVFCAGIRVVFSDGQIFHFLRAPFEYEDGSKINNYYREKLRRYVLASDKDVYAMRKRYIKASQRMSSWLKPFVLCVVCFASFWGGSLFLLLHGFEWQIIPCCISTAFLLKLINDHIEW